VGAGSRSCTRHTPDALRAVLAEGVRVVLGGAPAGRGGRSGHWEVTTDVPAIGRDCARPVVVSFWCSTTRAPLSPPTAVSTA
jgi:hypothetical protein